MLRASLAWLLALACWPFAAKADAAPDVDFERHVAKTLLRHCAGCHNVSDAKGGLDLTQRATALAGGESQMPAITPNEPDNSYLLERIRSGEMPPAGKGQNVTAEELAWLETWIQAGAVWPQDRVLSPFELTS